MCLFKSLFIYIITNVKILVIMLVIDESLNCNSNFNGKYITNFLQFIINNREKIVVDDNIII